VTSPLLQRGRQLLGEIPLTSFPGYFYQPSEGCRIWGKPWRRGRRHDVLEPIRTIMEENGYYHSKNSLLECDYTLKKYYFFRKGMGRK
jgi:hypothetical protein